MKVICMNGTIDIDAINDYRPDGEKPSFQMDIGTYKIDALPESRYGTFLQTTDRGAVFFADIAFKILMDLAIKAGLPAGQYLYNEISRGNRSVLSEEADKDQDLTPGMTRPDKRKAFGKELAKHGVENVCTGDCSRIVANNLGALSGAGFLYALWQGSGNGRGTGGQARIDLINLIRGNVYVPKEKDTFWGLHECLVELFGSFDTDDVKDFLDNFYSMLDNLDEESYSERTAGTLGHDEAPAESGPITSAGSDDEENEEVRKDPGQERSAYDENQVTGHDPTRKIRTVRGADITGFDETYAAGYREAFYDKEIEHADSEGFFEKLVVSRANGTAAPLDLLSEAIDRQNSSDTPANLLKRNLKAIREDIEEASSPA